MLQLYLSAERIATGHLFVLRWYIFFCQEIYLAGFS